jgi:lipoprotein-anchoring transpeptidase ErfK/SrfK
VSGRGSRTGSRGRPAAAGLVLVASLVAVVGAAGAVHALAPRVAAEPERPAAPPAAVQAAQPMRLEIVLSERRLYEYLGDVLVNTFPVAVGQPGHEAPVGEWGIHQVDWNPDWTPPDSEWAEEADYTPPGHPANPMGRVRMIYRAPYSIHGTDILESLGRAASHGSIRMATDDIIALARRVMEHGGASRSEAWFDAVLADPTEMWEVPLTDPVPIINRP